MSLVMGYCPGGSASGQSAKPISDRTYARNPPKPRLYIYVLLEKRLLMSSEIAIYRRDAAMKPDRVGASIAYVLADPKTCTSGPCLRCLGQPS
jgi:hypothetical protein